MNSSSKHISVIVPACNRGDKIIDLLVELMGQDMGPSSFQVIIIDDNCDTPVSSTIRPKDYPFDVVVHRYDTRCGRSAACNSGIRSASGDIIVILDEDISVPEEILRLHYNFHSNSSGENLAAVGAVKWGNHSELTPPMYHLENSSNCCNYHPRILHDDLPYMRTGNFSIPRNILLENGLFDEDFKEQCYEDIELGERLRAKGCRIKFLKKADVRRHTVLHLDMTIKRIGRERV